MAVDVKSLSDEELNNLVHLANKEQGRRQKIKQIEAWEQVKKAFFDYTAEFGSIQCNTVEDEYFLDRHCNLDMVGKICQDTGF